MTNEKPEGEIKIGSILIAKDAYEMSDERGRFTIKGKEYPVIDTTRNEVIIHGEQGKHYFDLCSDDPAYWRNFFHLKGEIPVSPLPEQGEGKWKCTSCESTNEYGIFFCRECEGKLQAGKEVSADEWLILNGEKYARDSNDDPESQFYPHRKVVKLMEVYTTLKAKEEIMKFVDENIGIVNWKEAARQYIKNRLG